MTHIDIDAIRERERVILPGPWRVGEPTPTGPDLWELPILLDRAGPDGPETVQVCAVEYQTGGFHYPHADAKADAEFIAHARTDVPALLAKVDELTAEREHMELNPTGTAEWLKNRVNELTADLTQSRAQAATYANAVDELTAELEHLREQVFAQKPVVKAAEAWAEAWEELKGDDTVPYVIAQPSAALHDAIEQHRLMDMALTSARAEQPAVAR